MKVLIICPDKDLLQPGSASFARHQVYAHGCEELHAVVFARRQYGRDVVQIANNAWAHPTYSRGTVGLFIDAYRIARRILANGDGWVISAQDPFESGLVAYALARMTGVPLLVQEHGDFFSTPHWRRESVLNRIRSYVGAWLVRRAHHVRVVSARIKRTLIGRGVREPLITVTPVYTDTARFNGAEANEEMVALSSGAGPLVLTMARLVPQKNLALLIRAFIRAHTKVPDARLVIVGKGAQEQALKALAHELTLELTHEHNGSPIIFRDWTDDPAGAMKAADIYALSSNYEGWGRVCIEALAAGTPLLMTDVGCAGEVVKNEENGLVVPVGDEDAFTAALTRLLTEPELRARLAANGKRTAAALPTNDDSVELYLSTLHTCLHAKEQADQRS